MKIFGLSAFCYDSSCALIDNGELVCAVQEEIFLRKKHASDFPVESIKFCLGYIAKFQEIRDTIRQIDYIVFYDKPLLTFDYMF